VKEFLSQQGVDFQELNVAENEQAREEMVRTTGSLAVPTTVIDGKTVIGFDPDRLDKLLH